MHVQLEKKIDAPADAVWDVLGRQFVDIDQWATFVKSSRPIERSEVPADITAARNSPVPGRETMTKVRIVEVITAYSDADHSLTFHGVGLPKIVTLVKDKQSVRSDSATSCTVTFDVTMEFLGPFAIFGPVMKKRMTKQFGEVLDDLKKHVESALTHPGADQRTINNN